ncbi:unnamed protein product, partial [Staurois parvus]
FKSGVLIRGLLYTEFPSEFPLTSGSLSECPLTLGIPIRVPPYIRFPHQSAPLHQVAPSVCPLTSGVPIRVPPYIRCPIRVAPYMDCPIRVYIRVPPYIRCPYQSAPLHQRSPSEYPLTSGAPIRVP